jgi:hypothetical protein
MLPLLKNNMALDEHGVPERDLKPYMFPEDQPADQAGPKVNLVPPQKQVPQRWEVWVTPELQAAAKQFDASWDRSHAEALAELDLQYVALKFNDTSTKQRFLAALKSFADLYQQHLSTAVPQPDGGDQNGVGVVVRVEFFRPDVFSEMVLDLAKTDLHAVLTTQEIAELAERYYSAFSIPFVRLDLRAAEEIDRGVVDQLERALAESHKLLVSFLKLLLSALPSEQGHRVVVLDVNRIELDGEACEIKGAAKRALLSLALLRNKPLFNTKEFVRYYNGEANPIDARHDFDNAMGALKMLLPRVSWTSDRGNRTVNHLQIRVEVADDTLKEHLKMLWQK